MAGTDDPLRQLEADLRSALRPRRRPDALEREIASHLRTSRDRPGRVALPSMQAWMDYARRVAAEHGIRSREAFSGGSGWERLKAFSEALESKRRSIVAGNPSVVWIAAARRLDGVLFGVYSDSLREGLINQFIQGVASQHVEIAERGFAQSCDRPRPSLIADIESALALGTISRNIEIAAMRVGKGQTVALIPDASNFEVLDDAGVETAIQLFDERYGVGGDPRTVGTSGQILGPRITDTSAVAWTSLRDQPLLPASIRQRLLSDSDPYFPGAADLLVQSPALALLPPTSVQIQSHVAAAALDAVWAYLTKIGANYNSHPGSWSSYGYLLLPRRTFVSQLTEALTKRAPDISPNEALDVLRAEWIMHDVGFKVLIDLMYASGSFLGRISRAFDGSDANIWSSAFETSVQRLIDETPWRPQEPFRGLIGRQIRRPDGSVVTDIDAVAQTESNLLLIDAKAYVGTGAFRTGEHSAVRGLREKAEAAATSWVEKVRWMQQNPQSLGVSIEGLSLRGLVVTPFVPFLHLGLATDVVVHDLRLVSSISELAIATMRLHRSNTP